MIERIIQEIENKTMEKKIYNLIILDESGSMQSLVQESFVNITNLIVAMNVLIFMERLIVK